MNVNRINQSIPAGGSRSGQAANGGGDFQQVLESHMHTAVAVDAPSALAGVSAPPPIDPALKVSALELCDRAINQLESYQQVLGNLSIKAADLEPHVSALEERVIGLLELKEQLPAGDPLAQVLDRVSTSCYLETVKFRRGDYTA